MKVPTTWPISIAVAGAALMLASCQSGQGKIEGSEKDHAQMLDTYSGGNWLGYGRSYG